MTGRGATRPTGSDDMPGEPLSRALGDELRRERNGRGWTRQDLHVRMADLAVGTLATYELGTRRLSVERFVDLGEALGVSVLDILARALKRVGKAEQIPYVEIDLRAVLADQTADLGPLRRWAAARLRHARPDEFTSVRLDQSTLALLAEICGLDADVLMARLRSLTGHTTATG